MRRKSKKVAKIAASSATPSSSLSDGSDSTTNFNGADSESVETGQLNDEIDCKLDSDASQNDSSNNKKSDSADNDFTQSLNLKQEPVSKDLTESTFLFVELKQISIDYKCVDYSQLIQKFLCINSNASANHIKKFITKNMNILEDLFEIVLMCNGFEVKNKCPLLFLKNRFFSNQETIILYYAIVERKLN